MNPNDHNPLRVLIVGGGVAALEGALALRELAGDKVSTTLLTPATEFVYRPMRVREPFARSAARHYALDEISRAIGAELKHDAFKWLEPTARLVHTDGGEQLEYDALLLALGARMHPRFKHAITLDDRRLDEQMQGLIQDIEGGYVQSVAFIIPGETSWPLPIYELALMTAQRAWDMNQELSITIVTPERAPLAIFGIAVSAAVHDLLVQHRITTISSTRVETPRDGEVSLHSPGRSLHVDRIVSLPELFGPSTPGVPKRDGHGFIPIDAHCAVPGLQNVFAAGDAADFPIKFGGLAAQQADTAAEAIAAIAGADVTPGKLNPVVHAILLGGARPLYLSAHVSGSVGSNSVASYEPSGSHRAKIDAKHLSAFLEARDTAALR